VTDVILEALSNTTVQGASGTSTRIVKPQMTPSGKKYHQPVTFSFADIMAKVRARNIVSIKWFTL